jgi:hypothetical protein
LEKYEQIYKEEVLREAFSSPLTVGKIKKKLLIIQGFLVFVYLTNTKRDVQKSYNGKKVFSVFHALQESVNG